MQKVIYREFIGDTDRPISLRLEYGDYILKLGLSEFSLGGNKETALEVLHQLCLQSGKMCLALQQFEEDKDA